MVRHPAEERSAELKSLSPWPRREAKASKTFHDSVGDVQLIRERAGASGYLIKRVATDKLLEAIDDVCTGGSPMSCHIARKVVQFFHQAGPSDEVSENLSRQSFFGGFTSRSDALG